MSTREMEDMAACGAQAVRYLLLATEDGMQGGHSGYTHLAKYIQRSTLIEAPRSEPRRFFGRSTVHILHSLAASRWYRLASLKIESRAWWAVQAGFKGLVHFMWAERDWGLLDRFPTRSRPALCATFHSCPDTLPEVVRDTSRLQRLGAIILMSEVQRSFFESHGVPSERIHVIHHGVDCQYFTPSAHDRSHCPFTVLSVGNYRRNFVLLRKVCVILERYCDIHIKIVAPKDRAEFFRGMKNVTLVSGLSDNELRASYRDASCLLMTIDAATANNAVLEAMACGLPIVSETVGGIAEYTGAGCARLCEAGSAEELAEAILKLYGEPDLVARMGSLARERAKQLDWSLVAKRTVHLYEALLADSRETRCITG